jgi:hypothetical protein
MALYDDLITPEDRVNPQFRKTSTNPRAEAPSLSPGASSPDPIATANIRKPTFSERIANARTTAGGVGNILARGASAALGAYGVTDAVKNGISSSNVDNATLGVAGALNPVAGVVGNVLRPIRDFAAEGITRFLILMYLILSP